MHRMYSSLVCLVAFVGAAFGHFSFINENSDATDELSTALHYHFNDHEAFHANGFKMSPVESFTAEAQQDTFVTTGSIVATGCFYASKLVVGLGTCFNLYNGADVGIGSFYLRVSLPPLSSTGKPSPKAGPGLSAYDGSPNFHLRSLVYNTLDCSGTPIRQPDFVGNKYVSCPSFSNATEYFIIWYYYSLPPSLPNEKDLSYGILAKYVLINIL